MYGHLTLLTWRSGKIVDLIPIRGGALNMPPRGSFMQLLDKHRYRIFHLTRRQNNLAVLLYLWHYQQHIQPFYISPGFLHFFQKSSYRWRLQLYWKVFPKWIWSNLWWPYVFTLPSFSIWNVGFCREKKQGPDWLGIVCYAYLRVVGFVPSIPPPSPPRRLGDHFFSTHPKYMMRSIALLAEPENCCCCY